MYIPSLYKSLNKDQIKDFIHGNSFATLILTNNNKTPDANNLDPSKQNPIQEVTPPEVREKIARHIPFELDLNSDHYLDGKSFETLTGHMAKQYPIYNCFNDGDEALLIFQGPHSYVSPTWYDNLEAATWNYISIHVYGKIERLDVRLTLEQTVTNLKTKLKSGSDINEINDIKRDLAHAEHDLKQIIEGKAPQLEKLLKTQLYKYEKQFACDPMMSIDRLGKRFEYLKKYIGAIRIHVDRFEVDVQAAFKLSQDQTPWSRNNIITELMKSEYPGSIAIANEMKEANDGFK